MFGFTVSKIFAFLFEFMLEMLLLGYCCDDDEDQAITSLGVVDREVGCVVEGVAPAADDVAVDGLCK